MDVIVQGVTAHVLMCIHVCRGVWEYVRSIRRCCEVDWNLSVYQRVLLCSVLWCSVLCNVLYVLRTNLSAIKVCQGV